MTRAHAPVAPPVALTVAGSDSGGGAGIQADLQTFAAHGVFGTSAVTATTAQNTQGVADTHVLPVEHLRAQYRAVVDDFAPSAAKTGMLATAEVVETVTDLLAGFDGPVVVDPVMVAASGDRLLSEAAEAAYADLLAAARLATPNVDEAAVLADTTVETPADARAAGERIRETGVDAVLVKGGHLAGTDGVVDTRATHGSGCVLSSAVAARLASGDGLVAAVGGATDFLERAVRYGVDAGEGPGAVNPLVDLRDDAACEPTTEAVAAFVERVAGPDLRPLVPDRGLSVVGATPYAEGPEDVAAVEGRVVRTRSGVTAVGGVRFGTESPAAAALLDAREVDPALRFGVAAADAPVVERAFAAHATTTTLADGRRCAFGPTPDAVERAVAAALSDGKTD